IFEVHFAAAGEERKGSITRRIFFIDRRHRAKRRAERRRREIDVDGVPFGWSEHRTTSARAAAPACASTPASPATAWRRAACRTLGCAWRCRRRRLTTLSAPAAGSGTRGWSGAPRGVASTAPALRRRQTIARGFLASRVERDGVGARVALTQRD